MSVLTPRMRAAACLTSISANNPREAFGEVEEQIDGGVFVSFVTLGGAEQIKMFDTQPLQFGLMGF